ncbi:peptidylprolyl isomerase [Paremcibacter congregatus]|nr:peptidylprolyl isomerase [Paremcibacter congregatus]
MNSYMGKESYVGGVYMKWIVCILLYAMSFSWSIAENPAEFSDSETANKVTIVINTELGEIYVEVDTGYAPIPANNFLRYVDAGRYDDSVFYRSIPHLNLIQGGLAGQAIKEGHYDNYLPLRFPPVRLDLPTGEDRKLRRGSLAFAHELGDPQQVGAEFLLMTDEIPSLNYRYNEHGKVSGVKHFGRIVKGMEIVDQIYKMEIKGEANLAWAKGTVLTNYVKIFSMKRLVP